MIIRLTGGLGNQMFQYAFGRSKSIEKHTNFKYFFVHCRGDTERKYELNFLRIKGRKINNRLLELLAEMGCILDIRIPRVEYGYWQSEKYFRKYENIIRKDFTFKGKMDDRSLKFFKKINSTSSISLHVRRGDYVNNKKISQIHGAPRLSYYKKAIELVKRRVKNPVFFVFSDDIDWCKKNFSNVNNIIFVEGKSSSKDYEDMRLMSNCKHNIIANSSFSWWGAWLNKNPNKIVIAPARWFADTETQKTVGKNIIPEEWIKI